LVAVGRSAGFTGADVVLLMMVAASVG